MEHTLGRAFPQSQFDVNYRQHEFQETKEPTSLPVILLLGLFPLRLPVELRQFNLRGER